MRLPRRIHDWTVFIAIAGIALIIALGLTGKARADDARNPAWAAWFQSLSRFDTDLNHSISCCGDGDAVFADAWRSADGAIMATVTDNRGHDWAPVGKTITVPKKMEIAEQGNPTGHVVLFLRPGTLEPICLVVGGGLI
jgi:hypothetical protein